MPPYDRSSTPGRLDLDAPPLPPEDRLKPVPMTDPGDDTASLLGASNVNGDGIGVSADSPTGRALQGVMMMMQGANQIQTVVPGVIPPPIIQMIQTLSQILPEIVRDMQQMTGPGGMLSTMGMGAMGAGGPMSPMGVGGPMGSPMGGGGGGFGAGAPRNGGEGGALAAILAGM